MVVQIILTLKVRKGVRPPSHLVIPKVILTLTKRPKGD
jgi:hypothetical protein